MEAPQNAATASVLLEVKKYYFSEIRAENGSATFFFLSALDCFSQV